MRLGNYDALWLLFILVVLIVPAYIWNFRRKAEMMKAFAEKNLLAKINLSASLPKQIFKALLLVTAFIAIVVSLVRPLWNAEPKEIKRTGRDIVILLDTSRSMLAEDIRPNRLERAKIAVSDLMEKLGGDRIGIITFAGSSTVKCPLTQDYAFATLALSEISTESTGRGGTNVGDAIRKAAGEVFDEKIREYKDIILISDGEDLEDSLPVEAAAGAGAQGIRIIAVGLGSETEGAMIPVINPNGTRGYMTYQGEPVRTKLDSDTLRSVALASSNGAYIPVETGTFDLGRIYEELVESARKRELESAAMMQYYKGFQIFLGLAIVLLIWETLLSERKRG